MVPVKIYRIDKAGASREFKAWVDADEYDCDKLVFLSQAIKQSRRTVAELPIDCPEDEPPHSPRPSRIS